MRRLTVAQILLIHRKAIERTGGATGVRDLGVVESAAAQPRITFDGVDLYPSLIDKGAALSYTLITGHAFVDGNKRTAHAALVAFLRLNGLDIDAHVDDQERVFMGLAAGEIDRHAFGEWLQTVVRSWPSRSV